MNPMEAIQQMTWEVLKDQYGLGALSYQPEMVIAGQTLTTTAHFDVAPPGMDDPKTVFLSISPVSLRLAENLMATPKQVYHEAAMVDPQVGGLALAQENLITEEGILLSLEAIAQVSAGAISNDSAQAAMDIFATGYPGEAKQVSEIDWAGATGMIRQVFGIK